MFTVSGITYVMEDGMCEVCKAEVKFDVQTVIYFAIKTIDVNDAFNRVLITIVYLATPGKKQRNRGGRLLSKVAVLA